MSVIRENGKKLKTGRSADSLFYPFRALGFIVDDKPFSIYNVRDETFCVTSIYKSFQIYKCDHLNVVFVSPPHPHKIRAITNIKKTTYVASGNCLYRWKNRNKEMKFVTNGDYKINQIYAFAETLLLTTDEKNVLRLWTKDLTLQSLIDFKDKTITCMLHPSTYINKLLVGTREGHLELWNLHTKKLIFQFERFLGTPITCLAEAPAIDVVGIGFADGRIVVHNIKYDKTIVTFQQAEGVVTSLSFRTDRNPFLVSGTHAGSVAIWDLEEKKLVTIMSNAHSGSITCAKFLPGEPVMLTSGVDNALKMWIFDQVDGSARLLRSRTGHSAPPTFMKNYSPTPVMLTAGSDLSVRYLNVAAPKYNFVLSQTKAAKKLSATAVTMNDLKLSSVQDLACSITKEGVWDNMVTCHAELRKAVTWNIKNKTMGAHTLPSTSPKKGPVKSVAISVCGNFAVLGSQCGWIDIYNLQSGAHRGTCPSTGGFAHEAAITSLFVDNLNQHIISTSLDGTIKIWDFQMRNLAKEIDVGMPINKALHHSDSSLLAVMPDDFTIKIYDLDTQKLVRNLEGHDSPITCAIFTPDSRWIISSSTDGTLRVWDLPTGQLVEWYTVKKPITSMSFTPAGNFLVTTHVGSVGVYLWANSNYYSNYYIRPVTGSPRELLMPGATSEEEFVTENLEDVATLDQEQDSMDVDVDQWVAKDGLVTLSGVPNARWTSIPDWEEIKKRNKPVEPVKKPEKAPFFLPTMTTLEGTKFVLPEKEETDEFFGTKIMSLQDDLSTKSKFVQALEASDATNDFTEPFTLLKDMPPAGIDFEFRTLSLQHDFRHLRLIMRMINNLLDTNHNFELLQAFLNLFLKIHGDLIAKEESLHQLAIQLKQKQRERWNHVQYMFQNSLCLVKFLSNIQMN